MALYTKNPLDKLFKQDLILICLSLQSKLDKTNNEATKKEEVRNLSDTVTKLGFELSITKNTNTTTQKMKFFIKDFFSKCGQIRSFLRIWLYLLMKCLMENFIFV